MSSRANSSLARIQTTEGPLEPSSLTLLPEEEGNDSRSTLRKVSPQRNQSLEIDRRNIMRKNLWVICLVLFACLPVAAQDTPKVEVFGGYSWAGGNFHGWNTSVTGNLSKSFGLVADFSGHYGSELDGPIFVDEDAHSFLFGPRFSHRGKRLTPFAYALFGVTRFHESATISGQRLSDA